MPDQEIYVQSAVVVKSAADNSCLYHSLSFILNYVNLYSNNGFTLRRTVNDYIRDNLLKYVWTSPEVCETFTEAIVGEGYNTSDYYATMSLNSSWGGMIEVCAVAELFHVNIHVCVRNADPRRPFKLLGSYKCSINDAHTAPLHLLYTGNNHYDSLIDIIFINDKVNGVSNVMDNESELFRTNNSTCSEVIASTPICDADRVQIWNNKANTMINY